MHQNHIHWQDFCDNDKKLNSHSNKLCEHTLEFYDGNNFVAGHNNDTQ
jgi:hypothetical protein